MMWDDKRFIARCLVCDFVRYASQPWSEDEVAAFCPNDGLPLQRLACNSCGKPVAMLSKPGLYWGTPAFEPTKFCVFCGERVELIPCEPQMRGQPVPRKGFARIDALARRSK